MKLNPREIAHKIFTKKMFGIDETEVYAFLSLVAEQTQNLQQEIDSLQSQLKAKDFALKEFQQKDDILQSTISSANSMADRYRADAEREARLILMDAQSRAEHITQDAQNSLRKIYEEISSLKRMRHQFEANLKALAQAHLSLLDQGDTLLAEAGNLEKSRQSNQAPRAPVSPANRNGLEREM